MISGTGIILPFRQDDTEIIMGVRGRRIFYKRVAEEAFFRGKYLRALKSQNGKYQDQNGAGIFENFSIQQNGESRHGQRHRRD